MLIDDTIKATVDVNFGQSKLDALECKEKLVNDGKLQQSLFQQMLMKQAIKAKDRILTKTSELRHQTDNFVNELEHRVVHDNTRQSVELKSPEPVPASPSKIDTPMNNKSDEKKIKEHHTAIVNDPTFYEFITKKAPVMLLEQEDLKKNLNFHR